MFRFACSVVLWGGRGTADKCHWHVWGELVVFWPHWVCPRSRHVCLPCLHCLGSRLLYRERALSCVALPRPKLLRFRFSGIPQRRRLSWACILCLPRPSSSGSLELDECTLPACSAPYPLCSPSLSFCACRSGRLVSLLGSWSLVATLPVRVNHPESQEVFGWKLETCLQFGRGCRLWG